MTGVPVDTVGAFVGAPHLLRTGSATGPLAGTTMGVKDLFDIEGLVTGAGTPAYASTHEPATTDALAVTRLVDAGVTVVGKTISDELAWSLAGVNMHYGAPRNVAAPGRRAGGSSSGSAAAVTAALVDLGLGTDTGGSIRVPASQCGILGWRPSHGAVPVDGVVPLAPSFDTVGLLARDVRLLALGMDALLGGAAAPGDVSGRVLGLAEAWALVGEHARAGLRDLTDDGTSSSIDVDLEAAAGAFRTLQGREAWQTHGHWFATTHPDLAPDIATRLRDASRITDAEVAHARVVADGVTARVLAATAAGDVLLLPAAPGAAPPLEQSSDDSDAWRARALQLTCIAGLAGAPVVVAPLLDDDALPLGAAFVGPRGSDRALLALVASRL
jgi:amidase